MSNPIRGVADLTIGGKAITLRFGWDEIARLEDEYGENRNLMSPKTLAGVIAIGSGGTITADEIRAASPPIMDMVAAVTKAINYAYFGEEKAPEAVAGDAENPTKEPAPETP